MSSSVHESLSGLLSLGSHLWALNLKTSERLSFTLWNRALKSHFLIVFVSFHIFQCIKESTCKYIFKIPAKSWSIEVISVFRFYWGIFDRKLQQIRPTVFIGRFQRPWRILVTKSKNFYTIPYICNRSRLFLSFCLLWSLRNYLFFVSYFTILRQFSNN